MFTNCGNKSENEQSYTSNSIRLDRNTDYEIVLTQSILWYLWYTISSQFNTIRLNTRKKNKEEWTLLHPMGFMMKKV